MIEFLQMTKHLFNLCDYISAWVSMSSEEDAEGYIRDADIAHLRRLGMKRVGGD